MKLFFRPRFLPILTGLTCLVAVFDYSAAKADDASGIRNISIKDFSNPSFNNGELRIPSIEITGTNATEAEIRNILSGSMSLEDRKIFLTKLVADKIDIGEITYKSGRVGSGLTGFHAENVVAGRAGKFSLSKLQIAAQPVAGADSSLKSGAVMMDNFDFGALLSPSAPAAAPMQTAPIQSQRISISDLEISAMDKTVPATSPGGNLLTAKVHSFKLDGAFSGKFPTVGIIDVSGISITPPKTSALGKGLNGFGYETIAGDLQFKGRFDATSRTYLLEDSVISVKDAGTVHFESKITDVDPDKFLSTPAARAEALAAATLAHFSVNFVNNGFMEKLAADGARRSFTTVELVKSRWAEETAVVWPGMVGDDTNAAENSLVIQKFIASPKSITITADPKETVKLGDLAALLRSHDSASRFKITATQQ